MRANNKGRIFMSLINHLFLYVSSLFHDPPFLPLPLSPSISLPPCLSSTPIR